MTRKILLAAFILTACGGGSEATTVTPPPAPPPPPPSNEPVASVTITSGNLSLTVGQTTTLVAKPRDAAGADLSGRTVTWSSDAAAVASVSAGGSVTAVTPGTAHVTATSETKSATITVTVVAAPVAVASVSISAPKTNLAIGESVTLTALPKDAQGNTIAGRAVTWLSLTPAVASVSAAGVVSGLTAGTSIIRATSDGKTGDITVSVADQNASLIEQHILAQQGLAIALASTVLQSQIEVLFSSQFSNDEVVCEQSTGGGSYRRNTGTENTAPYQTTVYFDDNCTRPYMIEQVTTQTMPTQTSFALDATAQYRGPTGTVLGSMHFVESADLPGNNHITLHGLGTFTPASGAPPVSLGLNCDIVDDGTNLNAPCQGGISQNFAGLSKAIGSVSSLTLHTPSDGTGAVTFAGTSVLTSGPVGSLTLTAPAPLSLMVQGGSLYGNGSTSGSAGTFSLFPPTPTGWSVSDAANDQKFTINVIDNATRNLSGTITRISTGAVLATFNTDQSGTGSITYSNGSTSAITSWTLAQ